MTNSTPADATSQHLHRSGYRWYVLAFVASTIVCVLGAWAWNAYRRLSNLAEIAACGASGLDYGPDGLVVTFRNPKIGDNHRADFPGLAGVAEFDYHVEPRPDRLISSFATSSAIVSLDLCGVTISDASLKECESMRGLRRLFVDGKQVSREAIERLAQARAELEIITDSADRDWLRMFPPVAPPEDEDAPINCAIRREAAFANIVRRGGTVFSNAPGHVTIRGTYPVLCGNEPTHLYRILTNDTLARDRFKYRVTDDVMPYLKDLNVQVVELQYSDVTDDGLLHIRNHPTIRSLSLGPRVTDRGLENLGEMPKLGYLSYGMSKITPEGLEHFLASRRHRLEVRY